jgi:hypothetical protein
MYQCYYDYLSLRYDDGTSLWDEVFDDGAIQNDLFNNFSSGHPMREFMGFETTIALTDKAIAFSQMVAMMDAITDQGEGSEIKKPSANMLQAVMPRYQPRDEALRADYPSYSDKGVQIPSADAAARFHNDSLDHYERFQEVRDLLAIGAITTWDQRGTGNWTAKDLTSADYDGSNPYNLPTPDDIAGALNTLSADPGAHNQLSLAVVGAIAGVTRVLDTYWSQPGQSFPFPSMVGSGDRMSIAWAVTGQTPDLSQGIGHADDVHKLYHACQGLVYDKDSQQDDPDIIIYHSCRGSNGCRSQGGCGFVQPVTGGAQGCGAASGCGTAAAVRSQSDRNTSASCATAGVGKNLCGAPPSPPSPSCGTPTPSPSICGGPPPSTYYSAPGDNKCGTFGGCAVPISAAQVFPNSGTMQLFDFVDTGGEWHAKEITFGPNKASIDYSQGEKVHDVAWKAYAAVMQTRGTPVSDEPPAPSTLRLVFPPST